MCTSRAPAPRIMLDDLARGRAAHDRVVDDDHPLAGQHLAHRRQLQLHAEVADLLRRLDEGAPHVVRAHQPLVVGDAALARVADGGRHARVGHRDDDVGRRPGARRRAGGPSARARGRPSGRRWSSRGARSRPTRRRSGAAARRRTGARCAGRCSSMITISPGLDVAHELGPDAARRRRSRDETTQVRPWPCRAPAGGSPSDRARAISVSSVRKTSE